MWGDDFSHLDASLTYDAVDKCIEAIEKLLEERSQSSQYRLSFSTIDSYLTSVYEDAQQLGVEFKT